MDNLSHEKVKPHDPLTHGQFLDSLIRQVSRHPSNFSFPSATNAHALHATGVSVYGHGILLLGNPGSGKSRLALELIAKGHRLIADDQVIVSKSDDGQTCLLAPDAWHGWMHVRNVGFIDLRRMLGASHLRPVETLSGVVCLTPLDEKKNPFSLAPDLSRITDGIFILDTSYEFGKTVNAIDELVQYKIKTLNGC